MQLTISLANDKRARFGLDRVLLFQCDSFRSLTDSRTSRLLPTKIVQKMTPAATLRLGFHRFRAIPQCGLSTATTIVFAAIVLLLLPPGSTAVLSPPSNCDYVGAMRLGSNTPVEFWVNPSIPSDANTNVDDNNADDDTTRSPRFWCCNHTFAGMNATVAVRCGPRGQVTQLHLAYNVYADDIRPRVVVPPSSAFHRLPPATVMNLTQLYLSSWRWLPALEVLNLTVLHIDFSVWLSYDLTGKPGRTITAWCNNNSLPCGQLPDLTALRRLRHVEFTQVPFWGKLPPWLQRSPTRYFPVLEALIVNRSRVTPLAVMGELPPVWDARLERVGQPWANISQTVKWWMLGSLKTLVLFGVTATLSIVNPTVAPNLESLTLSGSTITGGPLPSSWSGWRRLRSLVLDSTSIASPTLPSSWGTLGALDVLQLRSSSSIAGTIPSSWGSTGMTRNLRVFDVSGLSSLSGPIPTSWCAAADGGDVVIHRLEVLDLSSSGITGPLPSLCIRKWSHSLQHMYLRGSKLSGNLPASFALMRKLETFDADSCKFTGFLPASFGPSMRYLNLWFNRVEGTLPSSWSQMTQLEHMDIYGNLLNGSFPASWGPAMPKLSYLHAQDNRNMLGPLPESWSAMAHLEFLTAMGVTAPLPRSWGNLTALTTVTIFTANYDVADQVADAITLPESWGAWSNIMTLDISGPNLAGPIPGTWSAMSSLRSIRFSNTGIGGPISEFGIPRSSELIEISLDNTAIEGSLPAHWGWTLPSLQNLNLARTRVNGTLPEAWSGMSGIVTLNIGEAMLQGSLPERWGGNLTKLKSISLSHNRLEGTLPASWANLSSLQSIDLSDNQLSGTLPEEWKAWRLIKTVTLSSNRFSGQPPSQWFANVTKNGTVSLYLSNNQLTSTSTEKDHSSRGGASGPSDSNSTTPTAAANATTTAIPIVFHRSLKVVDLANNQLRVAPCPPRSARPPLAWFYIDNWANLRELYLDFNQLQGTMPACYTRNNSYLKIVSLMGNNLTGSLGNWSEWSVLSRLHVSFNGFTSFAERWPSVDSLWSVLAGNNQINDTSIPSELSALSILDFSRNALTLTWNRSTLNHWLTGDYACIRDFSNNEGTGGDEADSSGELVVQSSGLYRIIYEYDSPGLTCPAQLYDLSSTSTHFRGVSGARAAFGGDRWRVHRPKRVALGLPDMDNPFIGGTTTQVTSCAVICVPSFAAAPFAVDFDPTTMSIGPLSFFLRRSKMIYSPPPEGCGCPGMTLETLVSGFYDLQVSVRLEPLVVDALEWVDVPVAIAPTPTGVFFLGRRKASLLFNIPYHVTLRVQLLLSKGLSPWVNDTQTYDLRLPPISRTACPSALEYAVPGSTACVPCPALAVCNGTSMILAQQSWRPSPLFATFVACGETGCNAPDRQGWECDLGYTGVLCGACAQGYYRSGGEDGPCESCGTGDASSPGEGTGVEGGGAKRNPHLARFIVAVAFLVGIAYVSLVTLLNLRVSEDDENDQTPPETAWTVGRGGVHWLESENAADRDEAVMATWEAVDHLGVSKEEGTLSAPLMPPCGDEGQIGSERQQQTPDGHQARPSGRVMLRVHMAHVMEKATTKLDALAPLVDKLMIFVKMFGNHIDFIGLALLAGDGSSTVLATRVRGLMKTVLEVLRPLQIGNPLDGTGVGPYLSCLYQRHFTGPIDVLFWSVPVVAGVSLAAFIVLNVLYVAAPGLKLRAPLRRRQSFLATALLLFSDALLAASTDVLRCEDLTFTPFTSTSAAYPTATSAPSSSPLMGNASSATRTTTDQLSELSRLSILVTDRRVHCGSPSYARARAYAWCLASFAGVGVPLLCAAMYILKRQRSGVKGAKSHFAFMSDNFEDRTWFWELIILTKKNICVVALTSISTLQGKAAAFNSAMVIFLALHTYVLPYSAASYNRNDTISMIACILLVNIGLSQQTTAIGVGASDVVGAAGVGASPWPSSAQGDSSSSVAVEDGSAEIALAVAQAAVLVLSAAPFVLTLLWELKAPPPKEPPAGHADANRQQRTIGTERDESMSSAVAQPSAVVEI